MSNEESDIEAVPDRSEETTLMVGCLNSTIVVPRRWLNCPILAFDLINNSLNFLLGQASIGVGFTHEL